MGYKWNDKGNVFFQISKCFLYNFKIIIKIQKIYHIFVKKFLFIWSDWNSSIYFQ